MRIIDKLAESILKDPYFNLLFSQAKKIDAYRTLDIKHRVDFTRKSLVDSLRFSDILSNASDSDSRNKSYQLITALNSTYFDNEIYQIVSKAVFSKLGNYPAINYLEKTSNDINLPILRDIQNEYKREVQLVPQSDNLIFTDSQFELYSKLRNSLEFSFSGPTSMGKSFIIKAFIKKALQNSPPENLVIIVPTRALITQYVIDLKHEMHELMSQFKYRIATNSSIDDVFSQDDFKYILILTPERLISYLSQKSNPAIGFIFIDEAHKMASAKDSRSITTYTAIEKAVKRYRNVKLYFASPNVSNPEVFLNLFNRNGQMTFKTDESPVSQNIFFVDISGEKIHLVISQKLVEIADKSSVELISPNEFILKIGSNKSNLIYTNSKDKTITGAYELAEHLNQTDNEKTIDRAIKQIQEYIHPKYHLTDLLRKRVGFHYGKLPQPIRNIIEALYKSGEIKYVFCTSTLLEGVNLPTQNIFILNNKNGPNKLLPIDFWNLAGRAGRLTKELSGNIFCIQHDDCQWNDHGILIKNDIELKPTISIKIDKNIRKIEKLLLSKDISGTETEIEILTYIANIISIDTMEIQSDYVSPVIKKLIDENKTKIIDLAKERVSEFTIPTYILSSNQSINLANQNKIYVELITEHKKGVEIKLPQGAKINYKTCLEILSRFYELYNWGSAEKKLRKPKSLRYYAMLMNQWINGISLSQMIKQALDYQKTTNGTIMISFDEIVPFDSENKSHINIVINNLLDDVEYVLRYLFEKYFNNYHQIISDILGDDKAGENYSQLLEYGSQNRVVIALQNVGISRNTALKVYNKARDGLTIENNKITAINKQKILSKFSPDSLEHDELLTLL